MAHPPEVKAAVVADLLGGMSQRQAAKKHGVPVATVTTWVSSLKRSKPEPGALKATVLIGAEVAEAEQRAQFVSSLEQFLTDVIGMLQQWTVVASDERFIREKPEAAVLLGEKVLDAADRIVAGAGDRRQPGS